jgi:hypothetical protein
MARSLPVTGSDDDWACHAWPLDKVMTSAVCSWALGTCMESPTGPQVVVAKTGQLPETSAHNNVVLPG